MAVLALVACNGLLDLDPSIADGDHDRVADAIDNCPLDPNPQQRDTVGNGRGAVCDCVPSNIDLDLDEIDDACDDCVGEELGVDSGDNGVDDGCEACASANSLDADGDGLDDGCDDCTSGPPHDEDGDGVSDGCDSCPMQPDADPLTCRRGLGGPTIFDPLVEQDTTLWPGAIPGWTWSNDSLSIESPGSTRTTLAMPAPSFLVETRGTTSGQLDLGCTGPGMRTKCSFFWPQQQLELSIDLDNGSVSRIFSDVVPLDAEIVRFQLGVDPLGNVRCEAVDPAGASIAAAKLDITELDNIRINCTRIRVGAYPAGQLDYLWFVTE